MNMNDMKCPACGADLEVKEGRTFCYCQYCGTKVMLQNENEYVYRHIDEAGLRRAETERMVRMKELEVEEEQRKNRKKSFKIWLITTIALNALGIMGIMIEFMTDSMLGMPFTFCLSIGMFVGMLGIPFFAQGIRRRPYMY